MKLQALQISCADWYWVSLYVWYSRLLPKGIKLCSGHVISQPLTSFSLKNNWSLLSLCFTLSLGSTPFISSSTLFWYKFLHFLLTCYFNHHFFLFWFTTLHIHNSLSLSLLAEGLPVSRIPRSFTSSSRTALHGLMPGPFLQSYSVFVLSFFSFLCRALDWAGHRIRLWVHENIPHRFVSYSIVFIFWEISTR